MKIALPAFLLTLICAASAVGQALADQTDNQFWNETQVFFPIIKTKDKAGKTIEKLTFFVNGNLRFGQNMRHLADERIGFGITYKYNKHIALTPSYIYIAQQPTPGRKQYESRFRFAVGLENHWKKFSIDDRNLVEYRLRNGSTDSVRYRNRLRYVHPIVKNEKEIFAPFVADEVFYDFQDKAFTRNELSFGITKKFTPDVSADFFYLWQNNRSGAPKNMNVIGINLRFNVD